MSAWQTESRRELAPALTVTELNALIKQSVDSNPEFSALVIQGQVSGHKGYPSGHHYFSLVDPSCSVKCVLFRGRNGDEHLEDGAQVLVYGSLNFYHVRGELNIMVDEVKPYGLGAMQKEFEQLKAKLAAEGLFAEERKRELPRFPQRIAVVTSQKAAALQDVIKVLQHRYPIAELVVVPVTVQGEHAGASVIAGLQQIDALKPDVCLLVRGGGSPEDLWTFNNEQLARTIFAAPVPIVTGIGHEIDVTIADMVADVRAPTPSAAAEIATPDVAELRNGLARQARALDNNVRNTLSRSVETMNFVADRLLRAVDSAPARAKLDDYGRRAALAQTNNLALWRQRLETRRQQVAAWKLGTRLPDKLNTLVDRAHRSIKNIVELRVIQVDEQHNLLNSLSPYNILKRGYSVTTLASGEVVTSADQVTAGDRLKLKLHKGELDAVADTTRPQPAPADQGKE